MPIIDLGDFRIERNKTDGRIVYDIYRTEDNRLIASTYLMQDAELMISSIKPVAKFFYGMIDIHE